MEEIQQPAEVLALMQKPGVSALQAWREYRGFSLDEIAGFLMVWPANLRSWERCSNPCKAVLYKLAKKYECSIAQLMDD